MSRREYIFAGIFVLLLGLVVWITGSVNDEPWQKTFGVNDAGPYGSEVVYTLMPHLFEGQRTVTSDIPPYELVIDSTLKHTNLIFITAAFVPDEAETFALLNYVARGNVVFVAAEAFDGDLAEILGVETKLTGLQSEILEDPGLSVGDTTRIMLLGEHLETQNLFFYNTTVFKSILSFYEDEGEEDESNEEDEHSTENGVYEPVYTPLGSYETSELNFMRVRWGAGFFYISSVPLAFTNYNVLEDSNLEYVYGALSYLPVQPTFLDKYYKPGRIKNASPMRYIFSSEALWLGYLTLVAIFLIFAVSRARRRQRAIPVLQPRRNTTVAFAHTLGRLYFNRKDHTDLARKQIKQFKHFVQDRLHLPVTTLANLPLEQIAARTGVDPDSVHRLVAAMLVIEERKAASAETLSKLATLIDDFYKNSLRKPV